MEMDVEGVSPRPEPIPRSQGAGGACQAPPQPPQPQPQPQQQLAQDEVPSESAGAEDSDDPEARPNGERGESKRLHGLQGDGLQRDHLGIYQTPSHWQFQRTKPLVERRREKQTGRRPSVWLQSGWTTSSGLLEVVETQ
ncbi:transcriptional activator ptaB-like [Rattus rattus]|uniref:transcriptional activator ptaB-like n=1 Tax=Rattus rattus TaxID=10117 RepID=UPI0013F319F8|nr:transcriptional activator ptaB-like [Rattus rattus]